MKLNCCHIVPPGDITHTTFTLFIMHLHRMPECMQNSRHSSIMTSFLTCTTFKPLHLLLFLLPPVCVLTSPLYCHSSSPFLLVREVSHYNIDLPLYPSTGTASITSLPSVRMNTKCFTTSTLNVLSLWSVVPSNIQWNLDLLFKQRSFSRMYRSPFLVTNEVPYK